jgi:hypothetical protein
MQYRSFRWHDIRSRPNACNFREYHKMHRVCPNIWCFQRFYYSKS